MVKPCITLSKLVETLIYIKVENFNFYETCYMLLFTVDKLTTGELVKGKEIKTTHVFSLNFCVSLLAVIFISAGI